MVLRSSFRFPIHIGCCRCGKMRGHTDPCYGSQQFYELGNSAPIRETAMDQQQQEIEALGPAEGIIQTLTSFTDHMVHNRPGMVVKDGRTRTGVRWTPVIWKIEDGSNIVYQVSKTGRRQTKTRVGVMNGANEIWNGDRLIGEYRMPGLFPEVAAYLYRQAAEVWKMDNKFAAQWMSWSFPKDHRDLKVVLTALMLVQNRMGEPVVEDGEILFRDDDFRDVGEAACLIRADKDLNPKLLLRVGDVLALPQVAEINRELGFGASGRNPAIGRYYKVVTKWLRYRETNRPLLDGLVKAGFRTTVMKLARRVGYKPRSPRFFEILRWKQKQSDDGRRTMAIGTEWEKESWEGLSEKKVCEKITEDRPNWKRIVGLLPESVGMTRAVVAAAVEAGAMSSKDLIVMTPTFEKLGLLTVPSVKGAWDLAVKRAEDQRALNIARNVRSKEAKEGLQEAADKATEKAFEAVTRNLRVYVIVDKSGSMEGALDRAQTYLMKFLGGFPLDRTHVSVFNTMGTQLDIKVPKAAAVRQAFRGHTAGGGTSYSQGVEALVGNPPRDGEDLLMLFVGDEAGESGSSLANYITHRGLNPVAFGLLKVASRWGSGNTVRSAAQTLQIPCFSIDEGMFTSDDPYATTRLLQNLIASTPVKDVEQRQRSVRKSLVQEILGTELLKKPVWA